MVHIQSHCHVKSFNERHVRALLIFDMSSILLYINFKEGKGILLNVEKSANHTTENLSF